MPQIRYEQGVNGYTGTADTMLRERSPDETYAEATSLSVDSQDRNGNTQVLLRFAEIFGAGGNKIPEGARIISATLTLYSEDAGSGAKLHRMLAPWSEADTYSTRENGVQADGVEALAEEDILTGTQRTLGENNFDVTASLQAWSDGADNNGWAFLASGADGWDFSSSESNFKPVLTVEYTVDPDTPEEPEEPEEPQPTPVKIVAENDDAATNKNQSVTVQVLANDEDQDGDDLRPSDVDIEIVTAPEHGEVVINSDDSITYTPADGYIGDDSFVYAVRNDEVVDTAQVVIDVNDDSTSPPPPPPPPTSGTPFKGTVLAKEETANATGSGDIADDVAFWVNKADPGNSLVLGTNKSSSGGLYVYDMAGNTLQFLSENQAYNNVDVRYGFNLGGKIVDLVGVSNTNRDSMDFFAVDPATRKVTPVGDVPTGLSIYGFALGQGKDGKFHAFVTEQDGTVRQFVLDGASGAVKGTAVRTFEVGSQAEGVVVDDVNGVVYVSEENVGIWKYGLDPATGASRTQVDKVGSGGHLTADAEGLAIYHTSDGNGYLIASSQGNDTYNVYNQRGDNAFRGSFTIGTGNGIDSVEETDGLDVMSAGMGPLYPNGILAVHDHDNAGASNYKFVDWAEVAKLGNLTVDPAFKAWDIL